ncbi:rCG62032 [Rattus norvegicus]|uniref:RCG62032 n=1 Tax=Rattus norvegicus TaxID=10116 RepID=A6H9A2_RAT|nr:rCG62032 [Rattus norvegicus]
MLRTTVSTRLEKLGTTQTSFKMKCQNRKTSKPS